MCALPTTSKANGRSGVVSVAEWPGERTCTAMGVTLPGQSTREPDALIGGPPPRHLRRRTGPRPTMCGPVRTRATAYVLPSVNAVQREDNWRLALRLDLSRSPTPPSSAPVAMVGIPDATRARTAGSYTDALRPASHEGSFGLVNAVLRSTITFESDRLTFVSCLFSFVTASYLS